MERTPDLRWQGSSITATNVYRWAESGASIVILERVAYGAGTTRWYVAHNESQLQDVISGLLSRSCVSFYRDGRIKRARFSDDVEVELFDLLVHVGEAFLGWCSPGSTTLDMRHLDLTDFSEDAAEAAALNEDVYYGVFPARDNDGVNAITIYLPDLDGVVRPHPH